MAINTISGNTLLTSGFFPPVRVASTGSPLNPATGGLLVVDGVQLVAGDRVLCKDETNAVNNGIYAANTGPWTRTSDASGNTQFFSGMAVIAALGTANTKAIFICTCTDDPVVVGTSLITFAAQLPVGAGNVVGPGSSTAGDVATFADATGKLLRDATVTGTGAVVKATSPTLVTPTLGAATATSVNNTAITTPLSTATLTIASGKTLKCDNTLEFAGTDSTTMTFPNASDTVVGVAATQTLTNKTLTTPTIATITGSTTVTGTITSGQNAGTGGKLTLNGATSGSAVIGVSSTGTPQYGGTATNDNAPAGNIGEYVSSSIASGSAISLTTNVVANLTSISLTAGDWDVWGIAQYLGTGSTTVNSVQTSLSTTSATQDTTNGRYTYTPGYGATGFANPLSAQAGPVRFSLSTTTTIYLTVVGTFSASTLSAYGILQARRCR